MSTLDHNEPEGEKVLGSHGPKPEEVDASLGYEASDVRVTGIVVFLVSLLIFVGVCGILTMGMGHVINAGMDKEDGPNSKWTTAINIRELGNLPNSPDMQKKVAELTKTFPTPRVQTDDGNQDVADLHEREDLLLDNYSWVDQSKGTLRIPIERAMELIAQRGLPVAPTVQQQPLMAGDETPRVAVPLTNGFARTGYEQEQATARVEEAKQRQ
ncbi:MAG: hypothetical protein ACLPH3_00145 [Terracidiphilus sp.]